jgi:hypothetical protein
MREAIERFVASLAIPEERKAVVAAELIDHVACAREAAVRGGRDPEAAERAALGELEAMRAELEAVEPRFGMSRSRAMGRGAIASVLVAIAITYGGELMRGVVGALAAVAIAVAFAPPLGLLRGELRAPRVAGRLGRGVPIGPALTYAFTVLSAPFLIWIAIAVEATRHGVVRLDVPWSCFAVMASVWLVLLVEGLRARLPA